MPKFEPVLLANIGKPNSHTLAAYEASGGYAALRKVLKEMTPRGDDRPGEVEQSARPRRGRLSHRVEMDLPAEGPSRPDLHVHQCRRKRAGHIQQSDPDGGRSASGARRDHHLLLCHAGVDGLHLSAVRISALPRAAASGDRRMLCRRIAGQEYPGHASFRSTFIMHRGAAAYICGEETGPDRKPRRQTGLAADQAAVSGRRRRVPQADRGEQHRDGGLRHANRSPRRRLVQIDRRAVRSEKPARCRQLRPEAVLHQRPREQARLLRSAAGDHLPAVDRRIWRRRLEGAASKGGHARRDQHGPAPEAELDTPLDFAGPGKVGCLGLGTAAVVVLDETASMVDFLHNSCRFFQHESCGQCTPCREGTAWALRMLERIKAGRGRIRDLDLLLEIADSIGIIPGTTICGLADGAAWPMKNAIRKFRSEFEDYIRRTNPQPDTW